MLINGSISNVQWHLRRTFDVVFDAIEFYVLTKH